MQSIRTYAPDIITKRLGLRASIEFRLFDTLAGLGSFALENPEAIRGSGGRREWSGGQNWRDAAISCRTGDISRVAASDNLLAQMEQYELATPRRVWIDDVCGPLPNVPAFLSGLPQSMRRRERDESANAPLAIIVDLTTSAAISAEDINTRGAALLALVRTLSARRPVELWVCAGEDAISSGAGFVAARLETSPLDLSSAAYALTHAGLVRALMYGVLGGDPAIRSRGLWPFSRSPLTRTEMEAAFAPAMSHVTETLCIPGIHKEDPCVNDPLAWLARQIAEHAPVSLDA